tara:strand:+ start:419 stop:1093 length:675 start_codon:yes stop_codon:yes gene_type:complete
MALSKLVFKPGINREGTDYSNEGGWYDGDKIRFRNGYVERIRGWETSQVSIQGTVRKLHEFVTLQSLSFMMIGTEKKVYLEESGILYDITPYRRTVLFPISVTGSQGAGLTLSNTVGITIPVELEDHIDPAELLLEGAVGTVTITHNAEKIVVEGLSAEGTTGGVGSVSIFTRSQAGTFGQGEVGEVVIITMPVILSGVASTTLTPYTYQITADVGSVTVDTGS